MFNCWNACYLSWAVPVNVAYTNSQFLCLSSLSLSLSLFHTHTHTYTHSYAGVPEILISQPTARLRVAKSSNVYLHCPFISNPPATTVVWMIESTLLSGNRYEFFDNNGTLRISDSDTADSTNFTCKIFNNFGSENRTFNLLVLGEWGENMHDILCILNGS